MALGAMTGAITARQGEGCGSPASQGLEWAMRKSWRSVSRQYISGLHKSTITTGSYYSLAEFLPHLFRSLSSEGLPLTVVAGIEAVLSDNDWQLQAHGFCGV